MALSEELERRVDDLAGEYVARLNGGELADLDAMASGLPSEEARAALRELVDDTRRLVGLLPAQVRGGMLLAGRYRVGQELGSGGMGKVFAARDEELERDVALKVLASFGAQRLDPKEQFRKEAKLQASFRHDNVVTIHERDQDGDVDFIVMDLVDGIPISEVVEAARARRSEPRTGAVLEDAIGRTTHLGEENLVGASWWRSTTRIVTQVARALEAAHAHGLVHRDIKPQNIMLRGGGSPILLDFGLASAGGEAGEVTRGLFGSAAYLAPEQVERESVGFDVRADVYQLGAVMYELLTLERAFPGSNISSILERIRRGDLRPPRAVDSRVPFELEAICLCALERDPDRRYASMTEFREDLERYMRDERPRAAKGGVASRTLWSARRVARRPGVLVSAAAVALASIMGWIAYSAPEAFVPVAALSVPSSGVEFQALRFEPAPEVRDALSGKPLDVQLGALTVALEQNRGAVARDTDIKTLAFGDALGAEIAAAEETTIHALSVFRRDGEAFAMVVPVEFIGKPTRDEGGPWGLTVPGGEVSQVYCSIVVDAANETSEGLYMFATVDPEERDRLEDWLQRVDRLSRAYSPDRDDVVKLDDAFALLSEESIGRVVRDRNIVLAKELEPELLGTARGGRRRALSGSERESIEQLIAEAERERLELHLSGATAFSGMDVFVTVFDVTPSR